MEQYKIVRVGKAEYFIDSAGTWYMRVPSGLGAITIPRIKFGLPNVPFGPPQTQTLIRSRGTKPNERGQTQGQSNEEDIVLQEMGKPKIDFLENIAKSLQNVGTAIGDFKKVSRPPNRNVVVNQNRNQTPPRASGNFLDKLTTTQKAAGIGGALLLLGFVIKNQSAA